MGMGATPGQRLKRPAGHHKRCRNAQNPDFVAMEIGVQRLKPAR